MAIRAIVNKREPLLRQKSKPVTKFDKELHKLIDDMTDTLLDANGVGLAAPQVGELVRVVVIDVDEDELLELVNPKIIEFSGMDRDIEGCLSCPGEFGYVSRPNYCVVEAQDRYGEEFEVELFDLGARCAFHEIDHLEGKLFIDIVEEMVDLEELESEE